MTDPSFEASFNAGYEEAQSRLRMSMLCKDCVRPLAYPLSARIVELSILTRKLVKAPCPASTRIKVPNGVPGVGEVVEPNGALDGSPLSGANGEAERRS